MDPLKAAAAAAFCLILFLLAYRLTRRLVDVAIAQGHAEERRRLAEEEPQSPAGAAPQAAAIAAAVRSASNADHSSHSAIGAHRASTASIGIVHDAPAK